MKPAAFVYHAPHCRAEALALLAEYGGEARLLAGGQSLVPAMNARTLCPAVLIDLNRITELAGLRQAVSGALAVGAMTRQQALERSPLAWRHTPALAEVLGHVGVPQTRSRGTVGGSLAFADPAAEVPALALALDARVRAESVRGARWIAAEALASGAFRTTLAPDEMLTELLLPPLAPGTGVGFAEVSRRQNHRALAGAVAQVTLDAAGLVVDCRLALFGLGERVMLCPDVAAALAGAEPDSRRLHDAAERVDAVIDPVTDVHANAAYRRHLAGVVARRALTEAVLRAAATLVWFPLPLAQVGS